MKKLITTALLLAGLTISAQEIEKRFYTIDSTIKDGIDYIPYFESAFVDITNREDTIIVYPHLSEYKDKGLVIEGIFLIFKNNNQKLNDVDFVFDSNKIKMSDLKSYNFPKSKLVHFLVSKDKADGNLFKDIINQIEFNGKIYAPVNNAELYFVYMLSIFDDLKTNWIAETNKNK